MTWRPHAPRNRLSGRTPPGRASVGNLRGDRTSHSLRRSRVSACREVTHRGVTESRPLDGEPAGVLIPNLLVDPVDPVGDLLHQAGPKWLLAQLLTEDPAWTITDQKVEIVGCSDDLFLECGEGKENP